MRIVQQLRQAARALLRTPGFTLVSILMLALGLGANVAIFSVVRGVLLRPLPFADPDRVVQLEFEAPDRHDAAQSAANFLDIQRMNQSLSFVAGYREDLIALSVKAGEPEQVTGAYVTPAFFDVLGVAAARGRTLTGANPGERLFVASDEIWRRAFGSDPSAVGRSFRLNGDAYQLVGVMPPQVVWPAEAAIWLLSPTAVPPSPIARGADPATRDIQYFSAIARVKPDRSVRAAESELGGVAAKLRADYPDTNRGKEIRLTPVRVKLVGDVRPGLIIMQSAVGIVLLIACANISGLLLARAAGRRRELSIRAALGASRRDLIWQMLLESIVLGATGGAASLIVGSWLVRLLLRVMPEGIPRAGDIHLDTVVAIVSLTAAFATSVVFGLLPAWQASSVSAAMALKDAGERGSAGRTRGRSILVVCEVALTLMLLVAAGLLADSFLRLTHVNSGFRPDRVLVANLILPPTRYPDAARQTRLYGSLLEDLSGRPEIAAVGIGFPGPLHGDNAGGTFRIEGWPTSRQDKPFAQLSGVSGGFFQAMGISLRSGRTFASTDNATAPGVVVVNDALAHRYWPGVDVLGKRLMFSDDPKSPWATIVGVVADTRQMGLRSDPPPIAYLPYEQFPLPFTSVVVRTRAPEETVSALLRTTLARLDRDLPFADIDPLQTVLDRSLEEPRFQALLIGLFAAVALLLAVVGLYGVISYTVLQRIPEIGIRIALGAEPRRILFDVLRQGAILSLSGIALGTAGALLVTRLLGTVLFEVNATDPRTFLLVATLLLVVCVAASIVPSIRAARIEPRQAMR